MTKSILILFFGIFLINLCFVSAEWTSGLNNDLIEYFPMNQTESSFINSSVSSNYGKNLSIIVKFNQTGRVGTGLYWNQTSTEDHTLNFSFFPVVNTGNFSFSVWVNLTNVSHGLSSIFEGSRAGDGNLEMNLEVNSSGNVFFNINGGASCLVSNISLSSNNNYNIIIVRNSTRHGRMYVNNSLVDSDFSCGTPSAIKEFGLGPIVGGQGRKVPYGILDEFGYWNRTLSVSEVSQLYNNGTGITYQGNTDPTIILNSPTNNSNFTTNTIIFSVTPQDSENSTLNVSIYGNWTGSWHLNVSNTSSLNNTQTNFTISGIPNGKYIWNALVNDGVSSAFATNNFTFTVNVLENGSSENVFINNNLTVVNNISASRGLFNFLGSSISRILKGWFIDLDVSGTSNLTGNVYLSNTSCSSGQVLTTNSSNGLVSCTTVTNIKSGTVNVTEGSPVVITFATPFANTPYCTASVDLSGSGSATKGFAFFTHAPNTTAIRVDWGDTGASGTVIFNDQFTRAADAAITAHTPTPTGTNWTQVYLSGTAVINVIAAVDRARGGAGAASTDGHYLSAYPAPSVAEYDVEMTLSLVNVNANPRGAGMFARRTDNDNLYFVQFVPNDATPDQIKLVKRVAGVNTILGTSASNLTNGDVIKFEVRDATKNVSQNGIVVISSADNALTSAGTAGMGIGDFPAGPDLVRQDSGWEFDNFNVTEITSGGGSPTENLMWICTDAGNP